MPRFSANLGFLFSDRPELERVAAAAAAGFEAVEMHWPYQVPAAEMRAALAQSGVAMLGLNTPVGNAAAGDFGLGALAGRESEFQQAVDQAVSYGAAIGATAVHCMAGVVPPEGFAAAERTFVENLRAAADKAAGASMTVLIEPINHRDIPGFFLNTTDEAAAVIEAIGPERIGMQFDLYHCQITEGDVVMTAERHLPLIAHMQVADTPGRHEPGTGEVNWPFVFDRIDAMGFRGWIGCEYRPAGVTEDGLGWFAPYRS